MSFFEVSSYKILVYLGWVWFGLFGPCLGGMLYAAQPPKNTPRAALRLAAPLKKPAKKPQSKHVYIVRGRSHHVALHTAPKSTPTPSRLEPISFKLLSDGRIAFPHLPNFGYRFASRVAGIGSARELIFYSLSPDLQDTAEDLVRSAKAPHVAIVAMEPKTGRILALAQRSTSLSHAALHAGFPAASLFKLATAAAALDAGVLGPYSKIYFRGGNYTLNINNFKPDQGRDRRCMSLAESLGKSCNPVFARVALQHLSAPVLRHYARRFGFNTDLKFSVPLKMSVAAVPEDDYELARTAAGFGAVQISAVHAAALMSGIANGGVLPQPTLVDHIIGPRGELLYRNHPLFLQRMMKSTTAKALMEMMRFTITSGTSRYAFFKHGKPVMPGVEVAAKTGTLRGSNPPGLNRLFIAAAPVHNPKIAVAVIVVNPGDTASRPSYLGRRLLQAYLKL